MLRKQSCPCPLCLQKREEQAHDPLRRKRESTEKYAQAQGSCGTSSLPPLDTTPWQQPLKASLSLISGCHSQNSRLVTERTYFMKEFSILIPGPLFIQRILWNS